MKTEQILKRLKDKKESLEFQMKLQTGLISHFYNNYI